MRPYVRPYQGAIKGRAVKCAMGSWSMCDAEADWVERARYQQSSKNGGKWGLMAAGESDHYEKTLRVDQGILLEMK